MSTLLDRQLRLLHLQRLSPARGRLAARSRSSCTTTWSPGRRCRAGTSTRSCSPPAPAAPSAGTTSASAPTSCASARRRCSASASATRGSATCSKPTVSDGADGHARAPLAGQAHRRGAVRGHPAGLRGRALPLARRDRLARRGGPRDRLDRRRRRDGRSNTPTGRCGACSFIPSRSAPSTATSCSRTSTRSRSERQPAAPKGGSNRPSVPPRRCRQRPRRRRARACTCASTRARPTPSCCSKRLFGEQEHAFWLDSAEHPTQLGQCSYLGASPRRSTGSCSNTTSTRAIVTSHDAAGTHERRRDDLRGARARAARRAHARARREHARRAAWRAASSATSATSARPTAARPTRTAPTCPTPCSCSPTA